MSEESHQVAFSVQLLGFKTLPLSTLVYNEEEKRQCQLNKIIDLYIFDLG